ncbi:VOC family protein [Catellatospora sp. NPDC049609]|uniref:VOC family protein n=1 Tax=Catellatospora sp. NPDC049609 TaxID=3155505 RepID=UPI00341CBAF2
MDLKLEVLVLPVSDVDRAKAFYEQAGFRMDIDAVPNDDFRCVQFTPPGSECSIMIGKGMTNAAPGSFQGIYLIVRDIEAARAELVDRGIEVSEVFHDGDAIFQHGHADGDVVHDVGAPRVPGVYPGNADYGSYATFQDPDGNGWVLQEVNVRAPGR